MATDPKRRQKALAKKAAKRKEKARELRSRTEGAPEERLARAPVHECLVPGALFEKGIGNVIVSRRLPGGEIAAGVFLLDVFCLGVKSAFVAVVTPAKYGGMIETLDRIDRFEAAEPPRARALIEGAAAYSRDLGFSPHPDYQKARVVLQGIGPGDCPEAFPFGREGRPLYIPGPNDTPARQREVVAALHRRCGPEGFRFALGIGG